MVSINKNTIFWAGCILAALLVLWVASFAIHLPMGYTQEAGIGPDTWPSLVLYSIILLSAIMLVLTLLPNSLAAEVSESSKRTAAGWVKLIGTMVAFFTYYFAVLKIGIMPSSLIFFLIFAKACGNKSWKLLIPLGLLFSIGLYCFFYYVAKIPLPTGLLGGMI